MKSFARYSLPRSCHGTGIMKALDLHMKRVLLFASPFVPALFLLIATGPSNDRLWHHRNLGKAFYENPTTQKEAVEEFKKALDLAPDSARERLNYGLALLRAGQTKQGIAELEKAQKKDPKIPHTWFNLGIAFKKEGDFPRAIPQLQQMTRLVPGEPVSHYNLGALYKLEGKADLALQEFETAARLNPNLAGPHFQLFNQYRQAGRAGDAARELKIFQEIKKQQAGAAVPEDMEWSYYAEIYDPGEPRLPEAPAAWKFYDRKLPGRFDAATAGLAVLDFDGDGRPDLIAWSSAGVQLLRNGATAVQDSELHALKDVVSVSPGDFDNDGLPDLCVITRAGAALFRNHGGKFERRPVQIPAGRYGKAVWMDYDHDYDLDLVLLGERSVLLRNNGDAGFTDETAAFPFVKGQALDGVLFASSADTAAGDLVVSYADRPGVLYRDKLAGHFEAVSVDALPGGATSLVAEDFNHDGYIDLAAAVSSRIVLLENHDGGLKQAGSAPPGLPAKPPILFAPLENRAFGDFVKPAPGGPEFVSAVTAAFHAIGRADVAGIAPDGSLHLLENQTAGHNHWLQARLAGVKNLKLASGATVEVKAGASYQKQIYRGFPLLFGLGPYAEADTVRITWPNGLIQNEPRQPAGKAFTYKEAQRLSGSCPMIFAWNGTKFEFITDVLGVAPLGASSGDGQYFPVDHDEYVQIPGSSLKARNGSYEIRITEELREVSYLDQVRLIAVDHPADTEIFTNDKFKAPPFPEFRLYGVKSRHYPQSARDHNGRDVKSRLAARDRIYPADFRRDYAGVAELHHLDLDFGSVAPQGRGVLILNGWVDWADGSTFLAASQQGNGGLILPYLQVKNAAGQWQTVIEDMGLPAGKPKSIAVAVNFLSASREVRIVTNLCLYWDEIFLSEDTAAPAVRLTTIDAQSADLHFRGFSRPAIHPQRAQPESFDYAEWMPLAMWNPTPGLYTRYGDVTPLVNAVDDRFVVMGSGDELRLRFPAHDLPPLADGWRRDFLLFVDGWAKDGDANTAYSRSVEPLPFHRMSAYPYGIAEHFPDDEVHRAYLRQYNTRPALRVLRGLVGDEVATLRTR